MRGGQSTWRVPSRALLASADPGWPPTQLYHGRKTTTSQLLPDIFAFPGTLVCVSKNTKLVPKPWMKTRLLPARGSPQDPSFEEQLPSSPHRPSACPAPTPPGTPGHRHIPGEGTGRGTHSSPEQPCRVCSLPQNPRAGIYREGSKAVAPASLSPSSSHLPSGPCPGKVRMVALQANPGGLGWQCAAQAGAGPGSVNPSSGVSALGQPTRQPPACPAGGPCL